MNKNRNKTNSKKFITIILKTYFFTKANLSYIKK